MQNNFEKQVRDKMDELRFDPSEPVWQQVQLRIARKKDRRRLLFWLPLLFLLLGGGTWWLWQGGEQELGRALQNPERISAPAQTKENRSATPAETEHAGKQNRNEEVNKVSISARQDMISERTNTSTSIDAPVTSNNTTASVRSNVVGGAIKSRNNTSVARSNKITASASQGTGNNVQAGVQSPVASSTQDAAAQPSASTAAMEKKPVPSDIREVEDLVFNAPAPKGKENSTRSPWQVGITASVGVSGVSTGMGLFGQRYSADVTTIPNAGTSGQPLVLYDPAPPENGLSFSAGVALSKPLSSRVRIYTGIEYRYYSTKQSLGAFIPQDTVLSNGTRVDGYYRNFGYPQSSFTNQYHFIALPVSISWKVAPRFPLQVEGGLALQQMIGSSAVVYNDQSQVFYKDGSGLQKTALTSKLALNYSFFEKSRVGLLLGPELHWSFTPLQKTGTKERLVSLGLNARLFLQKK